MDLPRGALPIQFITERKNKGKKRMVQYDWRKQILPRWAYNMETEVGEGTPPMGADL